jgi:hypothetical protein
LSGNTKRPRKIVKNDQQEIRTIDLFFSFVLPKPYLTQHKTKNAAGSHDSNEVAAMTLSSRDGHRSSSPRDGIEDPLADGA